LFHFHRTFFEGGAPAYPMSRAFLGAWNVVRKSSGLPLDLSPFDPNNVMSDEEVEMDRQECRARGPNADIPRPNRAPASTPEEAAREFEENRSENKPCYCRTCDYENNGAVGMTDTCSVCDGYRNTKDMVYHIDEMGSMSSSCRSCYINTRTGESTFYPYDRSRMS